MSRHALMSACDVRGADRELRVDCSLFTCDVILMRMVGRCECARVVPGRWLQRGSAEREPERGRRMVSQRCDDCTSKRGAIRMRYDSCRHRGDESCPHAWRRLDSTAA